MVEPDELDYQRILEICRPYLGPGGRRVHRLDAAGRTAAGCSRKTSTRRIPGSSRTSAWCDRRGDRRGRCLCGAVRFSVGLPPQWVAHCHCSMCRRAHGAGFVTWVGFDRAAFAIESGAEALSRYPSSAAATRSFCSRCGSMLFFESATGPARSTSRSPASIRPKASSRRPTRTGAVVPAWADCSGTTLPTLDPPDHGADAQGGRQA